MEKHRKGTSHEVLTPEGAQPLGDTHSLAPSIPSSLPPSLLTPFDSKGGRFGCPGHPLYLSAHLPFPQTLSPPEQWAHWCWQDVRVQVEKQEAELQSALASPSGASWACGQLAAFPSESEPSSKLWYLSWPQTPQDWGHPRGLVSDAWLLAVSLSESLKPEAFHWQRRVPLPPP